MYTLLAAMKQFVKWLDYLKREGIYNNTRIIVVSDHGGRYHSGGEGYYGMEAYNPLLMVKEPEAEGPLTVSEEFMTHADTPRLAATGLFPAGENAEKQGSWFPPTEPLWAVDEVSSQPLRHGPYRFNLNGVRELKGKEMFRRESWGEWEKAE
jgi:arylsulfatase A-like enzyme